jgi:glycerol uptake facilitator-like aquaporin
MTSTTLSPAMSTAPVQFDRESGSQTTEYALIMVVAATIASLALAWARNGAIADLLDGVLDHVRSLFGMG